MAKANIDNEPNPCAARALQRFAKQLDAEVQEALDAARARLLAPFEAVLRRCQYIRARYVSVEPVRGLPKHLLRTPAGLAITADLADGQKAAESRICWTRACDSSMP